MRKATETDEDIKARNEEDKARTGPLIRRATKIVGSQAKLAKALGISQQGVAYFANRAYRVSGEIAQKIEKVTKGKVKRNKLRPDIFVGMKRKKSKKPAGNKRTAYSAATGDEGVTSQ